MSTLDLPQTYACDSLGLLGRLAAAPEGFDAARAAGEAVGLPFPGEAVRDVAVCGMGGSAIAGDLIAGAFAERLSRPVKVIRSYYLPGWVGPDTLCVLVSYSGDTEETLTCAMEALDRGALAVGLTSGGKLASWYGPRGLPIIPLPPGQQPRMALVDILVPMVVVLERLGILPPREGELDAGRAAVAAAVAAYGPDVPAAENPAKQIAHRLHERLPMIWGAEATSAVALRWKTQINENAKVPATWAELPELDHNEICAFDGLGALGDRVEVVMLRDARQHRQVDRRFDLSAALVEDKVRGVMGIEAEGEGILARMLDLVLLGDYVSLYMACLRQVDPGPVESIGRLKEALATTGHGRSSAASP